MKLQAETTVNCIYLTVQSVFASDLNLIKTHIQTLSCINSGMRMETWIIEKKGNTVGKGERDFLKRKARFLKHTHYNKCFNGWRGEWEVKDSEEEGTGLQNKRRWEVWSKRLWLSNYLEGTFLNGSLNYYFVILKILAMSYMALNLSTAVSSCGQSEIEVLISIALSLNTGVLYCLPEPCVKCIALV